MKKIILFAALPLFFLFSCEDDSTETITVDSSQPSGTFAPDPDRMGTLVEESGSGTSGMVELGADEDGEQFLHFAPGFETNLATGTVTVFLSTSEEFMPNAADGNPDLRLIGNVTMNGELFYKIAPSAESKFTHVILWCASANIPFGYAPLQ